MVLCSTKSYIHHPFTIMICFNQRLHSFPPHPLQALARLGAKVTGIDAARGMIEAAKQHASLDLSLDERLCYLNTTTSDLIQTEVESFDGVVASEVVEHVSDVDDFLGDCVRLVKVNWTNYLHIRDSWRSTPTFVIQFHVTRFTLTTCFKWPQFPAEEANLDVHIERLRCGIHYAPRRKF